MSASPAPEIPVSPCIGVCTLDEHEYCVGCRRHMGEIANWLRLSAEERRRIMADLPARVLPPENM